MELSFDYAPDKQFYAIRFRAGPHDSVPFLHEMRFWGVERDPSPQMGTLAALLVLKAQELTSVTLRDVAMNAPICTALAQHFGVEIHPAVYEADRRELFAGDKTIAPIRFGDLAAQTWPNAVLEILPWSSLADLDGPMGGGIRSNIDAFDLSETEKNLIVALCCGGRDVGHILIDGVDPDLRWTAHRMGLELIEAETTASG